MLVPMRQYHATTGKEQH